MKILFLCGSLEPGRDGVGDYVRRLSAELFRKGHLISAVALNDQHIDDFFFGIQTHEGEHLKLLRLPAAWPSEKRFNYANDWVNIFNPDWLSLQFVPFSFQKKGLPFFLINQLFELGKGRRWHIMFHELWVGMNHESPIKKRLWGKFQQVLIKLLICKLKPLVMHTQTILYQRQLKRMNYDCHLLPLFSNISNQRAKVELTKQNIDFSQDIKLVVFGSIHPHSQIEQLSLDAALYAKQHFCSVTLVLVGRSGPEQDYWINNWQAAGLPVSIVGEQSPENISNILRSSSLGITTTPLALIEKSGTVASMHEHGLAVLCVACPWTALGTDDLIISPDVFAFEHGKFADYLGRKTRKIFYNTLPNIAQQLTDSLVNF